MQGISFYFKREFHNGGKLVIRADGRTREGFEKDFDAMLKKWEEFEILRSKLNVI